MNTELLNQARGKFVSWFGHEPTVAAYAPGRVEVLGNHTDYNEGFVLSAAIDFGTFFFASPAEAGGVRLVAGDVEEEASLDVSDPQASREYPWANYVIGVLAGLQEHGSMPHGFNGLFFGNVPLGSGLSSSAALEMSSGLALAELYGISVDSLTMARIGQAAEHEYAGAKCGLLDQVSSLHGKLSQLIMTDFRSLEVQNLTLGEDACFLMCNTNVKHALVDGEYNERRESCEAAARYFADTLDHPVAALRDVSWEEWQTHADAMDKVPRMRSAHVIGENSRVLKGRQLLGEGDLEAFGRLMFESHWSSRDSFENSCPELDTIVEAADRLPGVLGARLSGGGFGGSVVALLHPRDSEVVSKALQSVYAREYGQPCDVQVISPSAGACLV